jgi:hypothetical protein
MISIPNLRRYRNSEFVAFMNDVIQLVDAANIAALANPLSALQTAYGDLETSFKVSQGSMITASIQELDARRDAAIKGIRAVTKAYVYHFDATFQSAGTLVLQTIDKYGRQISELNYQAQTASLKSLIKDIENDTDLTAALTTLHLTSWFAEMKTANEAFEQKYLERVTDSAAKKVAPVNEERPQAMAAYQTLMKHIEANTILNASPELSALTNSLNGLITKYNQI